MFTEATKIQQKQGKGRVFKVSSPRNTEVLKLHFTKGTIKFHVPKDLSNLLTRMQIDLSQKLRSGSFALFLFVF